MRIKTLSLLIGAICLTACASNKVEPAPRVLVKTEVVRPEIPPSLTDCAPPMPEAIKTMGDVKGYMIALHQAAIACRDDAEGVRSAVK